MPSIDFIFHIEASQEAVYQAITTLEGLRSWWTEDVQGQSSLGEKLTFCFNGSPLCTMEVTETEPEQNLRWTCTDGAPDWVGTQVNFTLSTNEGKTKVRFSHEGWAAQDDFFAICNFSWGRYMVSLRNYCETGTGDPWPKPELSSASS